MIILSVRTTDIAGVVDIEERLVLVVKKVIIAAALVVACGGSGSDVSVPDVIPERDPEQSRLRRVAHESEMEKCMSEAGFEYVAHIPSTEFFEAGYNLRSAYEFVSNDPDYVSQFGYGLTRWIRNVLSHSFDEPNRELRAQMDQRLSASWSQQSEKCFESASQSAGGGRRNQIIDKIETDWSKVFYDNIINHPRVTEKTPEWADCMENLGYQYSNLEEPFAYIMDESEKIPADVDLAIPEGLVNPEYVLEVEKRMLDLQQQEVALASDDVECRRVSGLMTAIIETRAKLQADYIRNNIGLLEELATYDEI